MLKISLPNSTKSLSNVASTCSSMLPPCRDGSVFVLALMAGTVTYVFLAVLNGRLHQLGIFGLLGGDEDERGVGGGILRLVLFDGWLA
jgi:hypothetical protein